MKDCNSCIHQRVCSLKGKYEDYKKEMEALMKKWGDEKENPFGFSMNCPEWHMATGVMNNRDGSKTIIGDNPYDPKKQKENKIWVNKSDRKDEPYKITFHNGLPVVELKSKAEDEIMATKEPKEEYDFVKELEKALGFQIRMDGIRKL